MRDGKNAPVLLTVLLSALLWGAAGVVLITQGSDLPAGAWLLLAACCGMQGVQGMWLVRKVGGDDRGTPHRLQSRQQWQDAYDRMEHQVEDQGVALSVTAQRLATEMAEHRHADDQLHESKRRFEVLARMAPVGIFYTDADGICRYVNQRCSQVTGRAAGEVLGVHWTGSLQSSDQDYIASEWRRAMEEGVPFQFEYRFRQPTGGPCWVLCQMVAERGESGQLLGTVGTVTDITRSKQAEMELALLAEAVNQTADVIFLTDAIGSIRYINTAFTQVTGYPPEEVLGRSMTILASPAHRGVAAVSMEEAMAQGLSWHGRVIYRRRDEGLLEVEIHLSPMRDACGEVAHFVAVARDVSSQVMLERQLRQSQKLEAIGALAGGIAHDFNNLLTPVLGFTEMALEELPEGSRIHQNLRMVMDAATRARDLVAQILTFGRCREQEPQPVILGDIVRETLRLLRATLPSTIRMVSRLDGEGYRIFAEPSRVHQVVMNLCTNAAQAMRMGCRNGVAGSGVLTVSLDRREEAQAEWVELQVQDTGCGMSAEVMERIFDPFFTTKELGSGTGLGLSMVHGIVKNSRGVIEVASRLGEGSTFRVRWPLWRGESGSEARPPEAHRRGTERILMVDDEPLVVELGRQMLEKLGYQVVVFTDSLLALAHFEQFPAQFDLVITDQTMPGLTGVELAARVMGRRPGLPVILTTGYSEVVDSPGADALGIRKFLFKPLTPLALTAAIREVLSAQPPRG